MAGKEIFQWARLFDENSSVVGEVNTMLQKNNIVQVPMSLARIRWIIKGTFDSNVWNAISERSRHRDA